MCHPKCPSFLMAPHVGGEGGSGDCLVLGTRSLGSTLGAEDDCIEESVGS